MDLPTASTSLTSAPSASETNELSALTFDTAHPHGLKILVSTHRHITVAPGTKNLPRLARVATTCKPPTPWNAMSTTTTRRFHGRWHRPRRRASPGQSGMHKKQANHRLLGEVKLQLRHFESRRCGRFSKALTVCNSRSRAAETVARESLDIHGVSVLAF